jgi:hypothetical protein
VPTTGRTVPEIADDVRDLLLENGVLVKES